MNIIINGFPNQRTVPIIHKVLAELNVKSFIYTYYFYKPDFGRFGSKATLINWRKINFFGDYDVDLNKLKPLDEEIVDSMRKYETIVLKMMDRLETMKNYSYRERKELYLKHLRFWNDQIERKKINLFISSNVPHETSDFVCYSLCKKKNIQTIVLFQTHIPDTTFICEDWEKSDYSLPGEYKKLKAKYAEKRIEAIKFTKRFEDYYQLQTGHKTDVSPFYMKKKPLVREATKKVVLITKKIKNDPTIYFKEFKTIATALWRRLHVFCLTKFLMNYYEKHCSVFDKKKKYIFLALHLQPEMSTSPRGDAFVEQLLIVQALSAAAPKGVKIFVKEHPNQNAHTRSKNYYKAMLSLPNVELMSRKTSSKELINNSLAVATCVGLAGFEGLFRLKPFLMFGHDFFQYFPGVFSIRTKSDLDLAIKQILKGQLFTEKDFKVFLKAVENVSINGTIDTDYLPTSIISNADNVENISGAILSKIRRNHV